MSAVLSGAGRAVGGLLGLSRQAPVASGVIAGMAAIPLLGGAANVSDKIMGGPFRRERSAILGERYAVRAARKEQEGLRKLKAQNLARLAALKPDVYNRVMAGMDLPDEATVIGGSPRVDLADVLAEAMVSGTVNDLGEGGVE